LVDRLNLRDDIKEGGKRSTKNSPFATKSSGEGGNVVAQKESVKRGPIFSVRAPKKKGSNSGFKDRLP